MASPSESLFDASISDSDLLEAYSDYSKSCADMHSYLDFTTLCDLHAIAALPSESLSDASSSDSDLFEAEPAMASPSESFIDASISDSDLLGAYPAHSKSYVDSKTRCDLHSCLDFPTLCDLHAIAALPSESLFDASISDAGPLETEPTMASPSESLCDKSNFISSSGLFEARSESLCDASISDSEPCEAESELTKEVLKEAQMRQEAGVKKELNAKDTSIEKGSNGLHEDRYKRFDRMLADMKQNWIDQNRRNDAIRLNRSAYTARCPIEFVSRYAIGTDRDESTPSIPSPRTVLQFWRLKNNTSHLATWVNYYEMTYWQWWAYFLKEDYEYYLDQELDPDKPFGNREQTVPARLYDSLEQAVSAHPDIALHELCRALGIKFKKIARAMEEFERAERDKHCTNSGPQKRPLAQIIGSILKGNDTGNKRVRLDNDTRRKRVRFDLDADTDGPVEVTSP